MPMLVGIDIETYSSVDIKQGLGPYTEAPDFDIQLIAYKIDDQPTRLIDLTQYRDPGRVSFCGSLFQPGAVRSGIPEGDEQEFLRLLRDPAVIKTAYNAAFERTCLERYYGEPMPPEQWRCTMVLAANLGLVGTLKQVGAILGLEKQKMEEGKNLIRRFCSPGVHGRVWGSSRPEDWETFKRYNVRDVDVETEIRDRLWPFRPGPDEQEAWCLDQKINETGVLIDRKLVDGALWIDRTYTEGLTERLQKITGLANPNSTKALLDWFRTNQYVNIGRLDKETVAEFIPKTRGPANQALKIRQELAKTSVKKYDAMKTTVNEDGRARGLTQFYGTRTGRWAGRRIQLQNLPQNKISDLATARELVKDRDLSMLELAFGEPPFVLSQLIRTALIPSPGCRFIVCDFSAIEARVLAWLAGEEWVLKEFRGEGLIYEATASMMFHVPKDSVRKGHENAALRSKGKVATLGCGYGGGAGALVKMGAEKSGIPESDLPGIVKQWRTANPHIVRYWKAVEGAAISAINGKPVELAHGVRFEKVSDWLFIRLPSGRRIAYYKPEITEGKYGTEITYRETANGLDYFNQNTYGGRLVENITQATARDCLRDSMIALDRAGYRIVFHVHDEVITDMPYGHGSLSEMQEIMGRPLPWAPGLPLRAAGFESPFYMKD